METVWSYYQENKIHFVPGAIVLGTFVILYRSFRIKKRECGVDYPKDTVILYTAPSSKYIPSMGHFAMKLETYLRVNRIPYRVCHELRKGPKGKIPWIEYYGMPMGDSQLIIAFLNKEFGVDINKHLSKEQRAVAWAIQKWMEEFTYWLNLSSRCIFQDEMLGGMLEMSFIKRFLIKQFAMRSMVAVIYTVGIGRHSNKEVCDMIVNDLRQFSEILGDKHYVMGETITEVDCAAFGILSEMRWGTPHSCPGYKLLTGGEIQNVSEYLDRIKNTYWPDWEKLCRNTSTRA